MQEGWAAFMGAIVGSIISSLTTLRVIAYQHSKLREKHIQDILIQDRIEIYKKINGFIFELWKDLPLPQVSLKKFYSKQIQERMANIKVYVSHNSLFLEPNVQQIFWEHFSKLEKWCRKLKHHSEHELRSECPDFEDKLKETLDNLLNCTRTAILEDLNILGFKNFSSKEKKALYKKSIEEINNYFKESN